MASAHDRAVLQAIFNPTTPFGDVPGLNQEEELIDDGEPELMCLYISCHSILNLFEHFPFPEWKNPWRCNQNLVLGDISVFFFATVPVSWVWMLFPTCLSPPARQWVWHRVAEASERAGDARCLCRRGWGVTSRSSAVQPGSPHPASASFCL